MTIQSILQKQDTFTNLEKQIADYFLNQNFNIQQMTTRQIANELYTTPSKVVRFTQKIGFSGYAEFKKAYLEEIASINQKIDYNFPFDKNDKTLYLGNKMASLYKEHIDQTLSLLTHDTLNLALNLFIRAKEIIIVSSGAQSELSRAFQERMIKIGTNVMVEKEMDLAYYHASHAEKSSLYIIISYSGQTPATLKVANKVHQRQIPMIAITTKGENALSKLATVTLYLSTHETLIENLGHFGTNISTLFLLDMLYSQYFNSNYQENLKKRIDVTSSFQTQRKTNNPVLKD